MAFTTCPAFPPGRLGLTLSEDYMIYRIAFIFLLLASHSYGQDAIIKTELNEYKVDYHFRTAMRIIPHGLIDQAKDIIISLNGVESLLSYERTFHIGSNSYGYIAHKTKDGIKIYLISCSKGNLSFITTTGICRKGNWQFELIKLLELSTKKLEEFDRTNSGKIR
jgi:hypothetical protein